MSNTPFLLQAKARTLNVRDIYMGGEEAAFDLFRQLRWPETEGEPVCPKCGCVDVYEIKTRRKFKCAACYAQFSATSGTIFAGRKMMFVDLLAAIALVTNGAKGISALQLARDTGCNPKTAWVLAHKIREGLAAETKGHKLSGEVEIAMQVVELTKNRNDVMLGTISALADIYRLSFQKGEQTKEEAIGRLQAQKQFLDKNAGGSGSQFLAYLIATLESGQLDTGAWLREPPAGSA